MNALDINFHKEEEAVRNSEELFEMMLQNITEHDKHLYIDALCDLEMDNKKIGRENVEKILKKLHDMYDKMVKDDFKFLDNFYRILFFKKNLLTFIFKCAFANVAHDCEKNFDTLKEDSEGKYWAFIYESIELLFQNTKIDFCNHEKTIEILDAFLNDKSLEEIMKI